MQAWNPFFAKDNEVLEKVQRWATTTRMITINLILLNLILNLCNIMIGLCPPVKFNFTNYVLCKQINYY